MDIKNISASESDKTEHKQQECDAIVFPQKFINPLFVYRLQGDFPIFRDSKNLFFNQRLQLGLSPHNAFKRISHITVNDQRLIMKLSSLDFQVVPWQYVVQRLQSLGDSEAYYLGESLTNQYEQVTQLVQNTPLISCNENLPYRATSLIISKYFKEIQQFIVTEIQYDLKLIEELGYNLQDIISFSLKYGIPDFSLKYDGTNQELFRNFREYGKPLLNKNDDIDYYLYSHLYPQGLKTQLQFSVSNVLEEGIPTMNFTTYYNYNPKGIGNLKVDDSLKTNNCVSHYYKLNDQQLKRCGYKLNN